MAQQPPVQIRVAIQAAEDAEEPGGGEGAGGTLGHLSPGGGSASEDEPGLGHSGGSSGTEQGEEAEWTPPDAELARKLVEQVEFYFSDENLERDAFLLKHVRRNRLGYVSVKLLTSFKKVKQLTRDWRTTAHALRQSALLELDEEQRKVRRSTPVPPLPGEQPPGRRLLLWDLHLCPPQPGAAPDGPLLERLLPLLRPFGPLASVRVLRAGRELPPDVRGLASRHRQLGAQDCALLEFEEAAAASRAHEFLAGRARAGGGVRAVLVGTRAPKKKAAPDRPPAPGRCPHGRVGELRDLADESSANSSSDAESDPASPSAARRHRLSPLAPPGLFLSPGASPGSSPWSSPSAPRRASAGRSPLAEEAPGKASDYSSDSSVTPSGSPWVRRRRQAELGTSDRSPGASPLPCRRLHPADGLPVGVLRLPRGPDHSRGFQERVRVGF